VGLLGLGTIARCVARSASALGMRLIAHDPYLDPSDPVWVTVESVAKDEVFRQADVVTVHIPLTDDTRGAVGRRSLDMMKADAVLINTSRGGIVDEHALVDALRSRTIAGAAIDVFAHEPMTPEEGAVFDGVPGLVLTPHIAGVTQESNVRVSAMVAHDVRDALGWSR